MEATHRPRSTNILRDIDFLFSPETLEIECTSCQDNFAEYYTHKDGKNQFKCQSCRDKDKEQTTDSGQVLCLKDAQKSLMKEFETYLKAQ